MRACVEGDGEEEGKGEGNGKRGRGDEQVVDEQRAEEVHKKASCERLCQCSFLSSYCRDVSVSFKYLPMRNPR